MFTPEIGGLCQLEIGNGAYYIISKVERFTHTAPHTNVKIPILQVWGLNLKSKVSGLVYQGRPEDFPQRVACYRSSDSSVVYQKKYE